MSSSPEFREIVVELDDGGRVRAVQLGQLVYVQGLLPAVAVGAPLSMQLNSVLERMRLVIVAASSGSDARNECLDATGGGSDSASRGLDVVARVTFRMREVTDRSVLNDVWRTWFPDPQNRPPHKYVPVEVPGGYDVAVDALAVLGTERRTLEIAGVRHRDPMSMGALLGNLVFSSRLFAAQTSPRRQFAVLLDQARALMADAGGDLDELTQVTVFAPTPESAATMTQLCHERWTLAPTPPAVHVLVADLGGSAAPRMEIIGVLGDRSRTAAGVRDGL
ncbi:hypothetical protein [Nocardia jiangxiensis]|uniref:hypothetical protein n=1 Tax=Nocardia jiangxiensis TaxID=282685 RepID=UPI0012F648FE|nr:hypothetical protein [Nocardia jiangxiensis]